MGYPQNSTGITSHSRPGTSHHKDGMRSHDLDRHNYATRRLYDKYRNRELWSFRGVDGEGGNVPEPGTLFGNRHQYLSLRVGPNLLCNERPLDWQDCFQFLSSQPKGGYYYVAYFFDYDVTMMIRTMPEHVARELLDRHKRVWANGYVVPVTYGDYQFDYMPHKEFKVRQNGTSKWVVISDVGQFFQGSFLSTLKKWNIGTEEEQEIIRQGKEQRANFAGSTEEIEAYNALEVLLLEQLMEEFRRVCKETGYVPRKWQGPGHLAAAMLERHGVPRRDAIPILGNSDFHALANAAYYGGRFETTATGPINSPVWQYDINGAYVSLLRTLPCLTHGSWVQIKEKPHHGLWFGSVTYNHDAPRYLYNLPHRTKDGNIRYQKEGQGVYWSSEIYAAESAGTLIQFHGGWGYKGNCNCQWFDFVDSYYQERVRLGKSNRGFVLKLAGNSIYGKLAQSVGYAPWANPVWAGLITAGCRSLLIQAYRNDVDNVYMLATDGLFCKNRLDVPVSGKLGEWEETYHPGGIFIVQPGIYFIGDSAKTRGVERGRIYGMRPEFEQQWIRFSESDGIDHTISVPVTNFITARLALMRNKWNLAGTWENTTREISYIWENKRISGLAWSAGEYVRTVPHRGRAIEISQPYNRKIGGNENVSYEKRYSNDGYRESQAEQEQPDWAEPLL